jgi:hypothetical protein
MGQKVGAFWTYFRVYIKIEYNKLNNLYFSPMGQNVDAFWGKEWVHFGPTSEYISKCRIIS